jgi:alkylation response protein AidB-like acyl-CoA dehydrogenase
MFTDEQDQLRHTVRSFLDKTSPEAEVRRTMITDDGYDPMLWKQMAAQLGLQTLHIPDQFGGSGFGYVELCIAVEEMGAALHCSPFLATTVLGVTTLLESDDPAAMADLLPAIAAGESIATLAFVDRMETHAARSGTQYHLTGTKGFVLDGALADLLLVSAWTDRGLSLFAVDGDATGITKTRLPTMDLTRKQAELEFVCTPARLVGTEGAGQHVLDRVRQIMCVALANECAGGARTVMEQAVRYAKQRFQFGRAIGSFQAIKHKCADMLVDVESAKSAAYEAARVAAGQRDSLALAASMAKVAAGQAFFHAAATNIQVHGGIGFTWEHPAHLYFKRAKSTQLMFGDPTFHRAELAALLRL